MAAAKIRVSDVAKRMGKSEKDLIFQLQSLGAEVSDANQVLEPEVIQALITGKKLHALAQRHHARRQAAGGEEEGSGASAASDRQADPARQKRSHRGRGAGHDCRRPQSSSRSSSRPPKQKSARRKKHRPERRRSPPKRRKQVRRRRRPRRAASARRPQLPMAAQHAPRGRRRSRAHAAGPTGPRARAPQWSASELRRPGAGSPSRPDQSWPPAAVTGRVGRAAAPSERASGRSGERARQRPWWPPSERSGGAVRGRSGMGMRSPAVRDSRPAVRDVRVVRLRRRRPPLSDPGSASARKKRRRTGDEERARRRRRPESAARTSVAGSRQRRCSRRVRSPARRSSPTTSVPTS